VAAQLAKSGERGEYLKATVVPALAAAKVDPGDAAIAASRSAS
jgi:hypothetical protein